MFYGKQSFPWQNEDLSGGQVALDVNASYQLHTSEKKKKKHKRTTTTKKTVSE